MEIDGSFSQYFIYIANLNPGERQLDKLPELVGVSSLDVTQWKEDWPEDCDFRTYGTFQGRLVCYCTCITAPTHMQQIEPAVCVDCPHKKVN